jgi:hypothetical protein
MVVLTVAWAFLAVALVICGFVIGFILAFVILAFAYGAVNIFLTGEISHVAIRSDWKSMLVHGVALFAVLLVVPIPSLLN